jgi:hypothetical protein
LVLLELLILVAVAVEVALKIQATEAELVDRVY